MDLLSHHPYWPMKDGLPASYPALEKSIRCEVAVVGGGITGALVAWHLAEAGIKTVVLDRREVAHGSTAGSTSLLQYEIDTPLFKLEQKFGVDPARQAYGDSLRAIHDLSKLVKKLRIDCGFEYKGSVLLASSPAHVSPLHREYEARKAAGLQVAWWSAQQLAHRSSLDQPAAIFSKMGEAAQIDAYAFTHGLLRAATEKGALIFDRTTVIRHRQGNRGVELLTDRKARVYARWLVVASGYEAGPFLTRPVTTLHSTFAIASEPVRQFTGWPKGEPVIWDTANPYIYLRTTADRRIIMGGYDEPFRDPVKRDRLLRMKAGFLLRRFRQLFPEIPFEISTAWAGTFGKTKDGLPYIGEYPGIPRTWFALGYGGNGITYSLIAARLFRDKLLGRPHQSARLYGFDRKPLADSKT
jgi:glycine/D-amino acid oxidase-like deaminating enzyme